MRLLLLFPSPPLLSSRPICSHRLFRPFYSRGKLVAEKIIIIVVVKSEEGAFGRSVERERDEEKFRFRISFEDESVERAGEREGGKEAVGGERAFTAADNRGKEEKEELGDNAT